VVVAGDSSDNTRKNFRDMCTYYNVPYYEYSDKETLGNAIGKQFRASLAVIDENFGNQIKKLLGNSED
jgi:ribosomal protein L7Ae-like RNA K-turn-binding protein